MGTEAAEMGLASQSLPTEEVLPAAMTIARDIAENVAPVSAALAKQLMWNGLNVGIDEMIVAEGRLLPGLIKAPDSGEGVRAFFEKRTPKWQMQVSTDVPDLGL